MHGYYVRATRRGDWCRFPLVEHAMVSQGEAGLVHMRGISDNCMTKDKVLYDGQFSCGDDSISLKGLVHK